MNRASGNGLLVIGDSPVARRVCATLRNDGSGMNVTHLAAPGDAELATALAVPLAGAAVLIRDDVEALRYALALAHLSPGLPLVVTVFDRTIADQLKAFLPSASVISAASTAAPNLAGPCLASDILSSVVDGNQRVQVRRHPQLNQPFEQRVLFAKRSWSARMVSAVTVNHRHHDAGTRLLFLGAVGLAAILLADVLWLMLVEHRGAAEAFLEAARVVATVGPGAAHHGAVYAISSAVAILVTMVLTAMFTAGLVDRLLEPRLVPLVGPRSVPRRGHVIVVGMGQVGVRLCEELRAHGIPVVGVERDKNAPHVQLARRLGIPIVVGSGTERAVLERLSVSRCLALAAVGSNDLDNIAVAVATAAVAPSTRVVLRAGEHEAVAETRSLLPLGIIRDVTEIAATRVVSLLLERTALEVVADDAGMFLRSSDGDFKPHLVAPKEACLHTVGRPPVAD